MLSYPLGHVPLKQVCKNCFFFTSCTAHFAPPRSLHSGAQSCDSAVPRSVFCILGIFSLLYLHSFDEFGSGGCAFFYPNALPANLCLPGGHNHGRCSQPASWWVCMRNMYLISLYKSSCHMTSDTWSDYVLTSDAVIKQGI